jgi:hypothetical protein
VVLLTSVLGLQLERKITFKPYNKVALVPKAFMYKLVYKRPLLASQLYQKPYLVSKKTTQKRDSKQI